ncbi:3164_t:CDS:2, partial [Gigaspora margarita]
NPFAPRHPFRLLVAGTSESGKTSIVVHLLLESKYPKIYPWMSSKKSGYKIPKGISKNFAMDKQAPWYENLKIVPFFRSDRHDGISSIYIAQHFYETHSNIRANLKYISLHRGCGTLD